MVAEDKKLSFKNNLLGRNLVVLICLDLFGLGPLDHGDLLGFFEMFDVHVSDFEFDFFVSRIFVWVGLHFGNMLLLSFQIVLVELEVVLVFFRIRLKQKRRNSTYCVLEKLQLVAVIHHLIKLMPLNILQGGYVILVVDVQALQGVPGPLLRVYYAFRVNLFLAVLILLINFFIVLDGDAGIIQTILFFVIFLRLVDIAAEEAEFLFCAGAVFLACFVRLHLIFILIIRGLLAVLLAIFIRITIAVFFVVIFLILFIAIFHHFVLELLDVVINVVVRVAFLICVILCHFALFADVVLKTPFERIYHISLLLCDLCLLFCGLAVLWLLAICLAVLFIAFIWAFLGALA